MTYYPSDDERAREYDQPASPDAAQALLRDQIAAHIAAGMVALPPPPRVLHVDGDGDVALVLATLLVPETEVTHVRTLAEAERAIMLGRYALVVLDPDLPDGDGAALIAALKAAQVNTPVLLYSAREPAPHAHHAHAFLPKPWTSPRQLWRTMSQLLCIESGVGVGGAALG